MSMFGAVSMRQLIGNESTSFGIRLAPQFVEKAGLQAWNSQFAGVLMDPGLLPSPVSVAALPLVALNQRGL